MLKIYGEAKMSNLTFDGAMQLFEAQTSDPFPVDFDIAWQWLGYSRKDHAKTALLSSGFVEGFDFSRISGESTGGRPSEDIRLTIDCFKQWGMMAGTEQGRQIRRYFLECERIAKLKDSSPNLQDVANPLWMLIDGATARGLEPERVIDLHHRLKAPALAPEPTIETHIAKAESTPRSAGVEAVQRFCKDCGFVTASDRSHFVEVQDIWTAYERWYETSGTKLFSKPQDVFRVLSAAFPKITHARHPKSRRVIIRGLRTL